MKGREEPGRNKNISGRTRSTKDKCREGTTPVNKRTGPDNLNLVFVVIN